MKENTVFLPGWTTGKCLGQGSYGKVYEIYREAYGVRESAALKVLSIPQDPALIDTLRDSGMDDDSITAQFDRQAGDIVREYQIMEGLRNCPYIVHCEDLKVEKNGLGFSILMRLELLNPLIQALEQGHAKEEASILTLASNLCAALETCRQQNILHRDVKPQNIFLAPDGSFKLGDFGIARTGEGHSTMGVGTYAFMAPEVLTGQSYDSRADIYSLGLVLYWLLNNYRGPFLPQPPQSVTAPALEKAHARRFGGEALPKPARGSEVLQAIVLKACAFDPSQRYATAGEMKQDIDALIAGKHSSISALKAAGSAPAKKKWLIPLCAGAAALVLAVGGTALLGKEPAAPAETTAATEPAVQAVTFQDPVIEKMVSQKTGAIVGQITLAHCEHITDFTQEYDDTADTQEKITSLADLQYFPNLTSVTIKNCPELTDVSALAECTKLSSLSLNNVPAEDLSFLAQLSELSDLTLNQCGIKDYSALTQLKNLSALNVQDSCLTPGLGYLDAVCFYLPEDIQQGILSGALDLKEGIHYRAPNGSGVDLSSWEDNPGIAEILGDDMMLDDILVQLPQLTTLIVDSAQIQDASNLQQLSSLTSLLLHGHEGINSEALSQLTQLKMLTINRNRYRDLDESYKHFGGWIEREYTILDVEALSASLEKALPDCVISVTADLL